jgi:hypothetical protein
MGSSDTTGFILPATDLAGNPRIMNNVIDMGAYEWGAVGVNDQYIDDSGVKVWPNPTEGKFKVQGSKFKVEVQKVEIVDIFGKVVFVKEIQSDPNPLDFDISHLQSGIYLVRISSGDINITHKLVKVSR